MRAVAEQRFRNIAESLELRLAGVRLGASWEADVCRPYSKFARDEQKLPEERAVPLSADWFTLLFRTGRGFGKSWALNGIGCKKVKERKWKHFGIIGPTQESTRKIMVEHPACGMKAMAAAEGMKVRWYQSRGEIHFQGRYPALALVASAEKPGALSGPSFDGMLADEVRYWRNPQEVWTLFIPGMRLGQDPQIVAATNPPRAGHDPRVMKFLKELESRPDTFVQRGSSRDNLENLSPSYYKRVIEPWIGTALEKVEIEGEYAEEVKDALWTLALIEASRVKKAPAMEVVNIGVDPHGGAGECGIVGAGRGEDGILYLLADRSTEGGVAVWPRSTVALFNELEANEVIAEGNFGGDMVKGVLQGAAAGEEWMLPVKLVHASRGKHPRAEPVAMLWQKGMAKIVGRLPELELEMTTWVPGSKFSPNRLDGMVWAATSLMFGGRLFIGRAGPGDDDEDDDEEDWE